LQIFIGVTTTTLGANISSTSSEFIGADAFS